MLTAGLFEYFQDLKILSLSTFFVSENFDHSSNYDCVILEADG